jgi:hypothetical protein
MTFYLTVSRSALPTLQSFFIARPDNPATLSPKDNRPVSETTLINACPESFGSPDRTVEPALTPSGHPRVRVTAPGNSHVDFFPNAARDLAVALTQHAIEADNMAAQRKQELAKAEADRKAAADKPHPRAVRPSPADHPALWIWCENDGTFKYVYTNFGRFASKFTPGVSFVDEQGRFDPSPENVALWIKLATEAARARITGGI